MKNKITFLSGIMMFILVVAFNPTNISANNQGESDVSIAMIGEPNSWIWENGNWYYFDKVGNIATEWQKVGGKWYYLDKVSGAVQTGWAKVGTEWYYLNNSGAMKTDWAKVDTNWYYLNNSGAMQKGWVKVGGEWYYLNNSGTMQTGWAKIGTQWYNLINSGAMQTGWAKVGTEWYYLNHSGAMQTGWAKVGTEWYYLNNNGAMQTGWAKVGAEWYYLNNSGAMQTGLVTVSGMRYLLDSNGAWLPFGLTTLPTNDLLLPEKNSGIRTTPITNVVIHFTSNAAAKPKNPYDVQDIYNIFVDYDVSAHYLIGRNGEIYFLVPENRVTYHAGKGDLKNFPHYKDQLNKYSIGIEMMAIGTQTEMSSMVPSSTYASIPKAQIGYTEAQYKTLNHLLNDIVERNPAVKRDRKHIVGHDEYAPGRKTDPGSLFDWNKVGF